MRSITLSLLAVLIAFTLSLPSAQVDVHADNTTELELTDEAVPISSLSVGLPFIENVGQFSGAARFQAGDLWLSEDSLWLTVMEQVATDGTTAVHSEERSIGVASEALPQPQRGVNLKLSFVGANPHPRLEPFGRQDTYFNYLQGNDPSQWRSNVPVWSGFVM